MIILARYLPLLVVLAGCNIMLGAARFEAVTALGYLLHGTSNPWWYIGEGAVFVGAAFPLFILWRISRCLRLLRPTRWVEETVESYFRCVPLATLTREVQQHRGLKEARVTQRAAFLKWWGRGRKPSYRTRHNPPK